MAEATEAIETVTRAKQVNGRKWLEAYMTHQKAGKNASEIAKDMDMNAASFNTRLSTMTRDLHLNRAVIKVGEIEMTGKEYLNVLIKESEPARVAAKMANAKDSDVKLIPKPTFANVQSKIKNDDSVSLITPGIALPRPAGSSTRSSVDFDELSDFAAGLINLDTKDSDESAE